ncbi:MAG: sulfite exporter TauE/SafE family protein [Pirellulales bacterium]
MLGDYVILCLAAVLAGAVNAIAGGGTLLTFPALFAALGSSGAAAVVANATSTVALVPGAIAALAGYRNEIRQERRWATLLVVPSLIGGLVGSLLLVLMPGESFKTAVPWLILTAALLFALQPRIARWTGVTPRSSGDRDVGGEGAASETASTRALPHAPGLLAAVVSFQFLVAIYGGYFGAGIGILMLSALAIMGMHDIHRMNAVKVLLNLMINGVSVVVFVASGKVYWPYAAAMAVSSSVGGYVAAHAAKRANKTVIRSIIVVIGFGLAAYYFYRQFAGYWK